MGFLNLALIALYAALTLPGAARAELLLCGNKYCGIDAVCNNESNSCECPFYRPTGDPAFRCHYYNFVSCQIIGDPSLRSFFSHRTFLDFPCKYTLAKFHMPLLVPEDGYNSDNSRCGIVVHGVNKLTSKGSYKLNEVQVEVSMKIREGDRTVLLRVTLDGDSATYTYASNAEVKVTQSDLNGCTERALDYTINMRLGLCYIEEERLWSLDFPMCGKISVLFRAWEGESDNQPMRPGFDIAADGYEASFTRKNDFPTTMCDVPFGYSQDVYHDTCKQIGVVGKRNCAFHAFLTNNPPEQPHYCVASIQIYNLCPKRKRASVMNACGAIVTQLAKCVLKNNKDVMKVFESCIYAACINPEACSDVALNVRHGDDEDCNSFADPC